jgi:hypothetical protein
MHISFRGKPLKKNRLGQIEKPLFSTVVVNCSIYEVKKPFSLPNELPNHPRELRNVHLLQSCVKVCNTSGTDERAVPRLAQRQQLRQSMGHFRNR